MNSKQVLFKKNEFGRNKGYEQRDRNEVQRDRNEFERNRNEYPRDKKECQRTETFRKDFQRDRRGSDFQKDRGGPRRLNLEKRGFDICLEKCVEKGDRFIFNKFSVRKGGPFVDISKLLEAGIRMCIENHNLRVGDMVRIGVDHESWMNTIFTREAVKFPKKNESLKLLMIYNDEFKDTPLEELKISIQIVKAIGI